MKISKTDKVLEVGSGHNPHARADVLLDLFEKDTVNQHRGGTNLTIDRPFVKADVCDMPFKDKEFDYVMAFFLLEHIPNVEKAISEIQRVGKRGIIALPTEYTEFVHPCREHRWFCSYDEKGIIFKKKPEGWYSPLKDTFHTLWNNDKDYFWFFQHHLKLFGFRHEWEGKINYRIEPFNGFEFKNLDISHTNRGFREFVPHWLQVKIGKSDAYPKLKSLLRVLEREKP